MQIFYKEIPLEEGFQIADLPKHSRIVAGKEVSLASGIELFVSLRNQPIVCWKCKCVADRWVATLGKNDNKSKPVLNLYAVRMHKTKKGAIIPKLVMMTRDHIIPKSHGGKDLVENLRPGCETCNGNRGNEMNKRDLKFMEQHPHLICPVRKARGEEIMARIEREHASAVDRRKEEEIPEFYLGDIQEGTVLVTDGSRVVFKS